MKVYFDEGSRSERDFFIFLRDSEKTGYNQIPIIS